MIILLFTKKKLCRQSRKLIHVVKHNLIYLEQYQSMSFRHVHSSRDMLTHLMWYQFSQMSQQIHFSEGSPLKQSGQISSSALVEVSVCLGIEVFAEVFLEPPFFINCLLAFSFCFWSFFSSLLYITSFLLLQFVSVLSSLHLGYCFITRKVLWQLL